MCSMWEIFTKRDNHWQPCKIAGTSYATFQRPHHQVQVHRIISELRCHRHSTLFLSRPWWHWCITIALVKGQTRDHWWYRCILFIYILCIYYVYIPYIPYKSTKHSRFQMIQDYASHGLICIPPKFCCYVYKILWLNTQCWRWVSQVQESRWSLEVLGLDIHTTSKKDGATPNCRL